MPISSTSSASLSSAAIAADTSRVPIQTLGQNDFLKLLVTQMTSQDPLHPQKDTDFIAQMAQFSSLEQSKTMASDVSKLRAQQNFSQAYSLLGQTVSLQGDKNTTAQGIVQAVQVDAGTPKLLVNGRSYDLSQVLTVTPTPLDNSATNKP